MIFNARFTDINFLYLIFVIISTYKVKRNQRNEIH